MSGSSSGNTGSRRPRRADAERNTLRVLYAARELFSEGGANVSMDEVARVAEVGIGTLYRHFETKEALIEAASEQRFADILTYFRTVCRDSTDPFEALELLLRHIGEVESRDRAFASVVAYTLGHEAVDKQWRTDLEAELVKLVRSGQRNGSIRTDVQATDVFALTCGLASIVHHGAGDWRRYIDIMLHGLRSSGT